MYELWFLELSLVLLAGLTFLLGLVTLALLVWLPFVLWQRKKSNDTIVQRIEQHGATQVHLTFDGVAYQSNRLVAHYLDIYQKYQSQLIFLKMDWLGRVTDIVWTKELSKPPVWSGSLPSSKEQLIHQLSAEIETLQQANALLHNSWSEDRLMS